MGASEIAKLADLESREVLLGKLAGAMLASLSQAVYLLNAPLAQVARLTGALQAKAEQDPSILAGRRRHPGCRDRGDRPGEHRGRGTCRARGRSTAEPADEAPAEPQPRRPRGSRGAESPEATESTEA